MVKPVDGLQDFRDKQFWTDLDVLCLTAMHKDPQRRYGSVEALIRDIDRYADGRPLDARPDTFGYRLRKFVRRNRRAVAGATLGIVAIVALVVYFTVRLVAARDEALASAARTDRIQRFMLNLFEGGDVEAGPAEDMRVIALLDRGVQEAQSLGSEPGVQAELQQTLGGLYQKFGQLDKADRLLQSALDRRKSLYQQGHPDIIRSLIALGLLRVDQSRLKEAEQLVREALERARRAYPKSELRIGEAGAALGKVLLAQGKYDAAAPTLEDAVKVLSGELPTAALSEAFTDLANTYYQAGRYEAAESLNLRMLARDKQLFGQRHPNVAIDLYNLGNAALDRGDYATAEQRFADSVSIIQTWYGKEHPKAATSLVMLGVAIDAQGRVEEAEKLYRQALAIHERLFGGVHARVGQVVNYLGMNALKQRKFDDAETMFRRASTIFKSIYGDRHEFYGVQLSNLGAVYTARTQFLEAESQLRQANDLLTSALPAGHRYTAISQVRLGSALIGQGRFREAEPYTLAGYNSLMKHSGSAVPELRSARADLATIYDTLNEKERAREIRAQDR